MFGKFLLVLVSLAIVACTEPKYISGENLQVPPAGEKLETSCRIRFADSGLCVAWKWEVKPTESQVGSFTFRTFKVDSSDQFPVLIDPPAIPQVVLWMPSMGHGSSPITVTKLEAGTYRASQVFFVMAGTWDIKFQISDGNSVIDEAIDSISF